MRLLMANINAEVLDRIRGNRLRMLAVIVLVAPILSACQPSPKYLSDRKDRRNEKIVEKAISDINLGKTEGTAWEFANRLYGENPDICRSIDDAIVCQSRTIYTQGTLDPSRIESVHSVAVYSDESFCSSWVKSRPNINRSPYIISHYMIYKEAGERAMHSAIKNESELIASAKSQMSILESCDKEFRWHQ